jgi:hypothetical protein
MSARSRLWLVAALGCVGGLGCGTDSPFSRGAPVDGGVAPHSDAGADISFRADIDPLFVSKCLACHAGSAGALKLVGEPAADLTASRAFVDAAQPDQSPLYLKPTGLAAHGGGAPLAASSDEAKLLLLWIEAGAQDN